MPDLIRMAPDQLRRRQSDALFLAACIELARLEGTAPAVPPGSRAAYEEAIAAGLLAAQGALPNAWDLDSKEALSACVAAFRGDVASARAVLDADLEGDESRLNR